MKFKKIFIASIFFIALLFTQRAVAQINYSDIKVDELSDAKIKELMDRAEAIGYTDAQLEQLAQAQGMKAEEIAKLRKRVEAIRQKDGGGNNQPTGSAVMADPTSKDPRRKYNADSNAVSVRSLSNEDLVKNAFDGLRPKIFGADLFKNSRMSFEPNLRIATPANYVFGPDDEVVIDLSGVNDFSRPYNLKVSPEGMIRIPNVGAVSVGGLTVQQARTRIRSAMQVYYPAIKSGETTLTVNLGNIRSISVTLNGQVVKAGTFTLPSLSTVFHALYSSGGPNQNGSFRKIQLIRNNKVVNTIDVYDFLMNGVIKGDIHLQDQDVINIPVYSRRVEMTGEFKTPGIFEMLEGEKLSDLLNFAGGFSVDAYKAKVKVYQNTDKERKITDILSQDFSTYQPANGDKFFAEPLLERFENRVELQGAVFRPAYYGLDKGLTVKQLLLKADGLKEDAFLNRAYINRLNADNTPSIIAFDLGKLMSGEIEDIPLQREDKVIVSSIFDLREEYKVNIEGEIRSPGEFRYATNMTLEDLIQMAGGFKVGATPNQIEISRRINNSDANSTSAPTAEVFRVNVDRNLKLQGDKFILKPFDIVSVRSSSTYQVQRKVYIGGEVLSPGYYTIKKKDERISDLITRAGGLLPTAYTDGASLKRPGPPDNEMNKKRNADDEQRRIMTLKKLQQNGGKGDSTLDSLIVSDLVGINLTKILKERGSRYDLILQDGDIIHVPQELQTVKVTGEVLNPNNIVFTPNKGLKQYINGAGGFSLKALKRGTFVRYADGTAEAAKQFLFFRSYPKIKPGAEILVPAKPEKSKMGIQEIVGISGALASLAAILITLFR